MVLRVTLDSAVRWLWVILSGWLVPALAVAEAPLRLTVEAKDVDLVHRVLSFRLNAVADNAELSIRSPEGSLLYRGQEAFERSRSDSPLHIGWPELGKDGENFRAELKVTAADGRWVSFEVVRFYIEIPHEEVIFDSGRWEIAPSEQAKLEAPLARLKQAAQTYAELMDVKLYVAGHTDTVGQASDNQRLSERRAQAIAEFFVAHDLRTVPVFVRGFGEGALAIQTGDNVAEGRNRRAQYILSSFEPAMGGPGHWRRVR